MTFSWQKNGSESVSQDFMFTLWFPKHGAVQNVGTRDIRLDIHVIQPSSDGDSPKHTRAARTSSTMATKFLLSAGHFKLMPSASP